MGLLEQSKGLVLQHPALGILGAHIQKAHPGTLASHHALGIEAAHIGKLQEVFGGALHVGAAVDEHDAVFPGGKYGGHGGPADAADALYGEGRAGEQGAGAAGGDESISPAVLQEGQGHGHGGILLAAGGGAGIVFHGDDVPGVRDLNAGKVCLTLLLQHLADGLLPANQQQLHAELFPGTQRAFYDLLRGIVAAHCVNDDLHRKKSPSLVSCRSIPGSAGKSRRSCCVCLLPDSPGG